MSLTEHEIETRQDAEHDVEYEGRGVIRCPACGQHGCDLLRDYGKGAHADYECGCGWRFRADREGAVLREFGYASDSVGEAVIHTRQVAPVVTAGAPAIPASLPSPEALSV